ncbi:NAD(P)-dependent dehydrogenase, short-chain alcohol dehydrogenase family [Lentzea xinjiangensis]|uniref:NAD(P)-dependent dehydrogenase, short-chain alcohol dehydrogenase family n=1 Tax=Lentzea xinjiangensis TaxID=402600 RepID=A0A1H9WW03_9PSEU|nr:short chain dehydrogenase [Lentzea xinjiangensis]SES38025.1 NAD(P)-dependent dehydrogenase, short-chain alcohol dehydrogenase family [Lentzea xinjiangensis]
MRILLVGATGTLGTAVHQELVARKHDVVTVARTGGDLRYDVTDPAQVAQLYRTVGQVDALASAAGSAPYKPVAELTVADYQAAVTGKVLSQVALVQEGLTHVTGSFTLITGVLAREPVVTGAAAALANGAVEAFVRAAAIEIAPRRINAVSPTVFTESLDVYGDVFPGMKPVPLADVVRAYVRSIEGRQTGQVYVP